VLTRVDEANAGGEASRNPARSSGVASASAAAVGHRDFLRRAASVEERESRGAGCRRCSSNTRRRTPTRKSRWKPTSRTSRICAAAAADARHVGLETSIEDDGKRLRITVGCPGGWPGCRAEGEVQAAREAAPGGSRYAGPTWESAASRMVAREAFFFFFFFCFFLVFLHSGFSSMS